MSAHAIQQQHHAHEYTTLTLKEVHRVLAVKLDEAQQKPVSYSALSEMIAMGEIPPSMPMGGYRRACPFREELTKHLPLLGIQGCEAGQGRTLVAIERGWDTPDAADALAMLQRLEAAAEGRVRPWPGPQAT